MSNLKYLYCDNCGFKGATRDDEEFIEELSPEDAAEILDEDEECPKCGTILNEIEDDDELQDAELEMDERRKNRGVSSFGE